MIQKSNMYKVLKVFLEKPLEGFGVRQISRKIKLGLPSVSRYLKDLLKEKLVVRKKRYNQELYFANREGRLFRYYKTFETIRVLEESGLIDYLDKKLELPTIVLYGSHALGEDREDSDIDLFILSNLKEDLKLDDFESKIKKRLHMFIETKLDNKKISNEFINNLCNGIVLRGHLKVL